MSREIFNLSSTHLDPYERVADGNHDHWNHIANQQVRDQKVEISVVVIRPQLQA